MYDDVASSESNPHPGQLFNRPGGEDVYAGIQIVRGGAVAQGLAAMGSSGGDWPLGTQPCLLTPPPACGSPPQDYSHGSVTVETFLAVLAGNASGVPPPSRHSSGRVLAAGPEDKVFGARGVGAWGHC